MFAVVVGALSFQGGTSKTDASFDAETQVSSISSRAPGNGSGNAAGAQNADIVQDLTINDPDYNFSAVSTHTPPQATMHDGQTTLGAGNGPAVGDVVGVLNSTTHLGLTNNFCSQASPFAVDFTLMAAYPNPTEANANDGAGNGYVTYDPNPASGIGGSQWAMLEDSSVRGGIADNDIPAGVEEYPDFLEDIFDDGAPVYPLHRYWGGTFVASTAVTLNFMIFAPGALGTFASPNPANDLAPARFGYASITVLQNPAATAAPSSITDFCTSLSTNTETYGQTKANDCNGAGAPDCTVAQIRVPCEGAPGVFATANCSANPASGRIRYENPNAGTRFFLGIHASLRDSDGDGYENSFDTCPTAANVDNPRTTNGADGDNLDPVCDPDDGVGANNIDSDSFTNGDPWDNAGENCTLIANATQFETEVGPPAAPDNTARPRGGSLGDSLGDACDGAENAAATCPFNATVACGTAGACTNAADDDLDGLVNDGCPTAGAFAETGCLNTVDDRDEDPATPGLPPLVDDDAVVNDGCPSSATVATGEWYSTLTLTPVCFTANPAVDDTDNDGWCEATTAADANYLLAIPGEGAANDGNASRGIEGYAAYFPMPITHSGASGSPPPARQPVQVCNDGIDNDGDGSIDLLDGGAGPAGSTCRIAPGAGAIITATDTDGDGYSDETEIHVGTDALGRCDVGLAPSQSADWPADLGNGGGAFSGDKINVADLGSFVAPVNRLNTAPANANFNRRWDVFPGPGGFSVWINVQDLGNVQTLIPPMFGVKAYNAANICTAPAAGGLND